MAPISGNNARAATTVVITPVLFLFTQRYFIEGIALTGIKGVAAQRKREAA